MVGYYEIRVSGTLPPEALDGFEYLKVSPPQVQTVIGGPLCSQEDLLRLMFRLECLFRVPVIEVRSVRETPVILTGVTIKKTWGKAQPSSAIRYS